MTFEYLSLSNHKILVFSLFLSSAVLIDTEYDPMIPREVKTPSVSKRPLLTFQWFQFYKLAALNLSFLLFQQILLFNLRWKRILVLLLVWVAFLLLQIIKASTFSIALMVYVCIHIVVKVYSGGFFLLLLPFSVL